MFERHDNEGIKFPIWLKILIIIALLFIIAVIFLDPKAVFPSI